MNSSTMTPCGGKIGEQPTIKKEKKPTKNKRVKEEDEFENKPMANNSHTCM